jgi:Flp pilus assembly pilin Flp
MNNVMKKLRRASGSNSLLRDERGLSTVEYVIILVLVAAGAIGLWVEFGKTLTGKISGATKDLSEVSTDKVKPEEGTGTGTNDDR